MVEKSLAGKVIDDFQATLDAAKDTQTFERNKVDLMAKAQVIKEGGLARELTEAIKRGSKEDVEAVLARYGRTVKTRDAE